MVILLFGPPGCGKGTQSPLIASKLQIPAISTGEMLRAEIAGETPLGQQVEAELAAGRLADDDLVNGVLMARLRQPDCRQGFLLDGYPRTVGQAAFLDDVLGRFGHSEPLVIHLETPAEVLIGRISSRRQCSSCQRIYNLLHRPPRHHDHCDDDGAPLTRRRDDHEEVVAERLRTYAEQTNPVLSYYEGRRCYGIDADRSPAEVFSAIEDLLAGAQTGAPVGARA